MGARRQAQGPGRQGRREQGLQIGYEGYVKLYQEREAIQAKADQQRRKLNELQQANDLDGLADTFNNSGGAPPVQPNPKGGAKALPLSCCRRRRC